MVILDYFCSSILQYSVKVLKLKKLSQLIGNGYFNYEGI